MNIHVPPDIAKKHQEFDFRGVPWTAGGLTWMRAYHRVLNITFRFCFELECGAEPTMYDHILKTKKFS